MFKHIELFVRNRLPELPENHAFYFILLFRRKWMKQYFSDEEARRLFSSDEMKITDFIVYGDNKDRWMRNVRLKVGAHLHPDFNFVFWTKGQDFNIPDLYAKYPAGFSLMVKYNPSDLQKVAKTFLSGAIRDILENPAGFYYNIIPKWKSLVEKARASSSKKYFLIDIDYQFKDHENMQEYLSGLAARLTEAGALHLLHYASTTPSGGLHLIFETKNDFIKKIRLDNKEDIIRLPYEIKFGSFLTHVPGVNPKIVDITDFLKSKD